MGFYLAFLVIWLFLAFFKMQFGFRRAQKSGNPALKQQWSEKYLELFKPRGLGVQLGVAQEQRWSQEGCP